MSIEGVASSYADIYSENLTHEDIKNFDNLGVEWQGRNILDIRDDFCIKAIVIFARVYEQTALTNPAELPQLKAEIIQIFEDLFDTESEDEDETSSLLYRFDPISGTYLELIGAEGKFFKSVGKGFKKVGKKIGKGVKKAEKAVTKAVRETGRWAKEHPIETAAIVVAAATLGVTAAAIAGAGSAVANAASDDDHKKDQNKHNTPFSSPNPPPTQNTSTPVSNDPISPQPVNPIPANASYTQPQGTFSDPSAPAQPFIPPNPYIPYSQVPAIPSHQHDISSHSIFNPSASGTSGQAVTHDNKPLLGSGNIATAAPGTRSAEVELASHSQEPSLLQETAAIALHAGTKTIGLAVDGVLALTQAANPTAIRPKETIQTAWRDGVQKAHEKIDNLCSTNMATNYDPKNDPIVVQIAEAIVTNPLGALNLEQAGAKAAQAFSNVSRLELVAAEATAGVKAATAGRVTTAEEIGLASRQAAAQKVGSAEAQVSGTAQTILKNEPLANTAKEVGLAEAEAIGAAYNRAKFEGYKTVLRQEMEKPFVTNSDLKTIIDKIYRPDASIGSGSTAAAIRFEKMTGEVVRDKLHSQKGQELIKSLERWLKQNPNASLGDRAAAENIILDLKDALELNK